MQTQHCRNDKNHIQSDNNHNNLESNETKYPYKSQESEDHSSNTHRADKEENQNVKNPKTNSQACQSEAALPSEPPIIPQEITIRVEDRIFNLNLENLEDHCRKNILHIFKDKSYSLEELLVLFVSNLRDQSLAEKELSHIIQSLKSNSRNK